MKKIILILITFFGIFNTLFAEINITTKELKKGIHYSIDTNVNIRKEPSLSSEKIGKVNTGDEIEVLEKTEVYFESEGIYDCFYKVKCKAGSGYMFGGYISDNSDTLIFEGSQQVYFDKFYSYTIKIPSKIAYTRYSKLSEESKDILKGCFIPEDDDYLTYTEFAFESPSFEKLMNIEKVLHNIKGDFVEKKFDKVSMFTQKSSQIVKNEFVYNTISEIKIIKNQFTNASFITMKIIEICEPEYIDATEFVTFQNGKFIRKRRCANYAIDGIYQGVNTFVFPDDKGGEKNTIRIVGKYLKGNETTEEYDQKIFWNGKDFVDK